jgi:ADP-ribose pyrophosphatase YjhB (NUDIX family)
MPGNGPFLFLSKTGPPAGFWDVPPGGMCVSAFLLVRRGSEILLGKYKDDPRWEAMAGLDESRRRTHGAGWTIPARQLKFGEDPREAAHEIAEEILQVHGMTISEPRAEVDLYEPKQAPGKLHYDIWFLFDGTPPKAWTLTVPSWYAELGWHDPKTLPATEYARGHQDVVARWLQKRPAKK